MLVFAPPFALYHRCPLSSPCVHCSLSSKLCISSGWLLRGKKPLHLYNPRRKPPPLLTPQSVCLSVCPTLLCLILGALRNAAAEFGSEDIAVMSGFGPKIFLASWPYSIRSKRRKRGENPGLPQLTKFITFFARINRVGFQSIPQKDNCGKLI